MLDLHVVEGIDQDQLVGWIKIFNWLAGTGSSFTLQ